jgi:hypothetical protein
VLTSADMLDVKPGPWEGILWNAAITTLSGSQSLELPDSFVHD